MLDFRDSLIISTLSNVLKQLHYPVGVMLTACAEHASGGLAVA